MTPGGGRLHYARLLIAGLLLALILKIFVLDAVYVPSRSMEDAVLPGDYLILDKTGYSPGWLAFRTPDRGEVVAFTLGEGRGGSAGAKDAIILKRCVATAGDSIVFRAGTVLVNGSAAAEGVADPGAFFAGGTAQRVPRRGDAIPLDSAHCPLWREFIMQEGHALEYAPGGGMTLDGTPAGAYTVERDYIFVMGDNHDVSLDSRSWGYIPARDVVGKAVVIYWSAAEGDGVRWSRIGTLVR